MQIEDMILVSVDDHDVEPPDVFEGRLPAKYEDQAPQLIVKDDGTEAWEFRGQRSPRASASTRSSDGRPRSTAWSRPRFGEMRPGCYDVDERVRDMNANGVLGSMCFPSFAAASAGRLFAEPTDKDIALALLQAYNDWHIDEWCGAHPGRFIPLALAADLGSAAHGRRGAPRRRRRGATR